MPDTSLTQAEAAQRGALLRVDSYHVELDLTGAEGPGVGFRSRTRIRFGCTRPGATSWVDLLARQVHTVTLNGRALTDDQTSATGRFTMPGLAAENDLVVDAEYPFATSGQGLHRFVDPADQAVYVYTHLQTAHAGRVFACFDQPDLKASCQITVRAPAGWTVLSNSPLRDSPGPRRAGDVFVHEFAPTPPISTYLVAVAAGPWTSWYSRPPRLGVHARRSLASHVDPIPLFDHLGRGLEFFTEAFGTGYPFAKLDLCFVPEFNFGAMENAACILAAETFVFDRAVTRDAHRRRGEMLLHELAHQWFGNLVTLRWWDDLWLNEAFATWASIHALTSVTEFSEAWASFGVGKKAVAYTKDQSPATHPVVADIPDLGTVISVFDTLTYHKGAAVLRQLVAYVGVEAFLKGIRRYLATHAYRTATRADLINALQVETDLDLEAWTGQWLYTTGVSELRAEFEVDRSGRFTRFALLQYSGRGRVHRVAVGIYGTGGHGRLVRTSRHDVHVSGDRIEVPALVGRDAGELVLPNDDDLTYCRMTLDDRSVATLIDRIGDIADPLPRSLCWVTGWEMVRAQALPPRRFLAMVVGFLTEEPEIGIVKRLLRQAVTILTGYLDPWWARDHGWPDLVDRLLAAVADDATSADHRLAFLHIVADSLLTAGQLEVVRKFYDGSTPAGATVDSDLRWRLARALLAHGAAPATIIDDLLEADPGAAGQRRADQLRASVPTAEAKESAWLRVIAPDTPAARAGAVASGFVHPAQHRLLAPFVERYTRDIPLLWRRGPAEALRLPVTRLFPSWSVSASTLATVGRLLAPDQPRALRDLLGEQHAELALALALTGLDSAAAAENRPVIAR
jgi:aminopeptidase N